MVTILDAAVQLSGSVLLKYRKYVSSPGEAPDGVKVEQGAKGGYYYETSSRSAAQEKPKRPAGTPREKQPRERAQPKPTTQQWGRPELATWSIKEHGDSLAVYQNPDGTWKPERVKLHRQILGDIFRGVPSVQNPAFYLMGGGPAAGKSSILEAGAVEVPDETQGAHIDSDAIKGKLPEYSELQQAGNAAAAAIVHEESSYLAKLALQMAIDRSTHTVLDGTGDSSLASLQKKTDQFHRAGQRVVANYVSQPTEQALKNAAARAAKTGRVVPESVIRDTHRDVSRILPEALRANLFDECNLYDTSIKGQPRLVLSHKDGMTQVHDPELWKVFLAKGEDTGLQRSLMKARRYVVDPSDAPPGVRVERGKRGGYYYETNANAAAAKPVRGKRAPKPVSPIAQGFQAGNLSWGYVSNLMTDARDFSEADDYESRSAFGAKVIAAIDAMEEVDEEHLLDSYLKAGVFQDPAREAELKTTLGNMLTIIKFRFDMVKDPEAKFSNNEGVLLQRLQDYAHAGLYAMDRHHEDDWLQKVDPALREQAQLARGLFGWSQENMDKLQTREQVWTRIQGENASTEDRTILHYHAKQAMGRLPETHLSLISSMIVDDYSVGTRDTGQALADCDIWRGKIRLHYRGAVCSGNFKSGAVIHEIGHAVHGALYTAEKEYYAAHDYKRREAVNLLLSGVEAQWAQTRVRAGLPRLGDSDSLVESNNVQGKSVGVDAPSDYSLTTEKEWFAEQYLDYVTQPTRLKKNFPRVYDAMKTVFGGQEYLNYEGIPLPPGDREAEDYDHEQIFVRRDEVIKKWGSLPL